jgi:hypothetical protein
MATTTTNYGFDVPQSSDLVKNGATQIALLGQDLDTFLFRPFTCNGVLNSSFNVWQRGTTNVTTALAYTADRWQKSSATHYGVSRQVTGDTTNLPNIQYAARVQRTAASAVTTQMEFAQSFESINSIPFAGKTVTISFYARAGANYSATSNILAASVYIGTGTDQSILASGYTGITQSITGNATLTTTWQRFSYTGTLAATATELSAYFTYTPTGTAGANDYYEITGVMVEVGSQASPYTPATPTYATELAACQRYLPVVNEKAMLNGYAYGTNTAIYAVPFKVQARVAPTGITTSGNINVYALNVATTLTPTLNVGGVDTASLLASFTIVAGQGSRIEMQPSSLMLFTGCEL